MIQNTLCGHIKMNKSIYNLTVHFRLRPPIVNLNHEKSAKADQKHCIFGTGMTYAKEDKDKKV